jgi:hypothetical protein
MSEEETVATPEVVKPKKGPKAGVKAEEFAEFKQEILGLMKEMVANKQTVPTAPATSGVGNDDGSSDKNRVGVPPAWKEMVDQILGPEFDCEYTLPPDGGQLFTIIVPKEKSNATKEYIEMFKTDRRTKELGNTGPRGVKEWCLKVRQNLLRSEIKLPVYP